MKNRAAATVAGPMTTLMKKIDRQPVPCTRAPPTIGPEAMASDDIPT
ncbi:MAG TPA: hypothetical protein VGG75_24900 [Trebonia sp.]